ncbi:hypothetical protein QAD02_020436, partial [Eretmocerus hayati]
MSSEDARSQSFPLTTNEWMSLMGSSDGMGQTESALVEILKMTAKECCVRFKDPSYSGDFIFRSHRLQGAAEPPQVLKPTDYDSMNRGDQQYKPKIGFASNCAKSALDESGHRMLGHHLNNQRQPGIYGHVPPPISCQRSSRGHLRSRVGHQLTRSHPNHQIHEPRRDFPLPKPRFRDEIYKDSRVQQSTEPSYRHHSLMHPRVQPHLVQPRQRMPSQQLRVLHSQ